MRSSRHRQFGYLFGWLTLVALALALVGRAPGRITGLSALLLGLFALQSVLVALRPDMPAVAALHPLNGFLLLAVAVVTLRLSWAARSGARSDRLIDGGGDRLTPPAGGRPAAGAEVLTTTSDGGRVMVTVGKRAYDLMYRFGAPWEGADRVELRALVQDGRCAPQTLRRPGAPAARAIDLGCGAGGVSMELAEAGFEVTGVDFSPVALRKAAAASRRRGIGTGSAAVRCGGPDGRRRSRAWRDRSTCWSTTARSTTCLPRAAGRWPATLRVSPAPAPGSSCSRLPGARRTCRGSASAGRRARSRGSTTARSRRCSATRSGSRCSTRRPAPATWARGSSSGPGIRCRSRPARRSVPTPRAVRP